MNMSTAMATRKRAKPAPEPGAAAGAGKRRRKVSMAFPRARPVSLLLQPSFHPRALIGAHTFAQGPHPFAQGPIWMQPQPLSSTHRILEGLPFGQGQELLPFSGS